MLSAQKIESTYERIKGFICETPCEKSLSFSRDLDCQLFLKNEHMQYTGSFKLRGALAKITSCTRDELARGFLAASTGNHGMGVAWAAQSHHVEATIYLPRRTDEQKKQNISSLGAKIEEVDGDCLAAEVEARRVAELEGKVFISPYNDVGVIAGQGTIGLEISTQLGMGEFSPDAIFVAVGGGGLISGIGKYIKHAFPKCEVWGCWPQNASAMYQCLKAGKITPVEEHETLSTSTAGGIEKGSITFEYCQELINHQVLVSEDEIRNAIREAAQREHSIIEGSAAVALAGFLKMQHKFRGKTVVVVLCGRNIPFSVFKEIIS